MAIRLEVSGAPSGAIRVCGEDPRLGAWQPGSAFPLERAGEQWVGDVPIPQAVEFKLISVEDDAVKWEPVVENRRWPEAALTAGTTFKLVFGETKMQIEASASHMQDNCRSTIRKMVDRQGSALQECVDKKGENAYYYAHTRDYHVPEDAKVIAGPGLVTGGKPVLVEAGGAAVDAAAEDRTVWLKDYSYSDSEKKVKIYVPTPEGLLPAEGAEAMVVTDFKAQAVDMTIMSKPRHRLRIERLAADLKVDDCCTRVEPAKNRIVLQLVKKSAEKWLALQKK